MRRTEKTTQRITAVTLAVALIVAVYLNWQYSGTEQIGVADADAQLSEGVAVSADVDCVKDELMTQEELAEEAGKVYGEAQLVSVAGDTGTDFFELARLSRTKSRDSALELIKTSLSEANLTEEEKEKLTKDLTSALSNITVENEVETLIKAKGMVDCISFLDGGKASITVMTAHEALNAQQVAQIRDIILSKTDISAENITVVEVN